MPFTATRLKGLLVATLLGATIVCAQSTVIAIGPQVLQPAVKRLGVNLSYTTFYDSGQITKNLIFRNPGFEGEIFQSVIRCASGAANMCVDDDPYSGWPSGFWNGATVEFFYGQASGRKETVSLYAGAKGAKGGTFSFINSGTAPAAGDYMIVRMTVPGNPTAGWFPRTSGTAAINANTHDLPPGTSGKQAVGLYAPAATDVATIAAYFDSTPGKVFVLMNGAFELSFRAKGVGGANLAVVTLQRGSLPPYVSQQVQLTADWNTYTISFNASETPSVAGTVGLVFGTSGQDSFLLDDVSLVQTDSDPANISTFRDPVIDALRTLNPGILRFWANQLGDTLDNLIAGPFGRQRSGYSAFSNLQEDISYGLPEFLQLCKMIGAEPWLVVPVTFSTTDAAHLIEYLSGAHTTPYGAKRSVLGRSDAWTNAFPKIHLEFGNEAWNSGFKGGSIEYSAPYGQRAQTIFAAMRSDPSFVAASFDLVLGGQAATPFRNLDIQNNCNNNDTFALAPYLMNNVDSYSTTEALFGPTYAEPEAFHTASGTAEGVASGLIIQNRNAIASSTHPVPLALYEMNMSTTGGAIPQATLNNFVSSLGAGLAVASSMLQQMRAGIINQNMFALQQYKFTRSDGKSVFLWGSVVDMGVTDRRRPQFLALQLANHAIGWTGGRLRKRPYVAEPGGRTSMLQTVHTGADPTWNQQLLNTVQLPAAHYLQSFAFASGAQRSLIVFNFHRTDTLPVTFGGAQPPAGDVEMERLTSAQPGDTNEDSAKIGINTEYLVEYDPTSTLSLPPNSMTVLRWTLPPAKVVRK